MKEYNIEVVGAPTVGKSSYTIRLVQGIFVRNYDSTRQDLYRRKVIEQVNDHSQAVYQINLLDTIGVTPKQKDNTDCHDITYQFGQGFIVLYDITNEETFDAAKNILKEIVSVRKDKKIPIILIGNKLDRQEERQVLRSSGVEVVGGLSNVQFMEASVKDDTNIIQSIYDLVKMIHKRTGGVVPKGDDSNCVIS